MRMKNLFLAGLTALALCVGCCAEAADITASLTPPTSSATIINAGTNKVTALSTSAWYNVNLQYSTDAAIFIDVKYLNAVGAGDVNGLRMEWQEGIDSSTFSSNIWRSQTFQANSTTTTANSTCTNLTFNAVPYARFRLCNISTNAHVTNLLVKVSPKQNGVRTRSQ